MKLYEVKVVDKKIPYQKVVDFIEFVVKNSYDKDGRFHQYLFDYSEASAVISIYTDYDSEEFNFNDVMEFIQTDRWAEIQKELGVAFDNFDWYVRQEVNYINTPLRSADEVLKIAKDTLSDIKNIIESVDVEKLKTYDFTNLINAIDKVNSIETESSASNTGNKIVDIQEVKK